MRERAQYGEFEEGEVELKGNPSTFRDLNFDWPELTFHWKRVMVLCRLCRHHRQYWGPDLKPAFLANKRAIPAAGKRPL